MRVEGAHLVKRTCVAFVQRTHGRVRRDTFRRWISIEEVAGGGLGASSEGSEGGKAHHHRVHATNAAVRTLLYSTRIGGRDARAGCVARCCAAYACMRAWSRCRAPAGRAPARPCSAAAAAPEEERRSAQVARADAEMSSG
jgi:hypothetical protein